MSALPVALVLSACQTMDDAPVANTWSPVPLTQLSGGQNKPERINSARLSDVQRDTQSTIIEGTGRFVGEPPTGSVRASEEAGDDGVTLNLVNVPAPQAAKTILGDILSVKYTIDPAIQGQVTIQTPKPVAKSAVVDLFQSALRANNAAIVNKHGMVRIVPLDQVAVGASMRTDGAVGEQIGSGVQIVQLKYVSASEMRRVLEPVAPRGGIVRADDARNLITLSGNRQDISSMMEAISLFDIDVMKGMSFALVPVKMSQPDAIANELRTVFASDREGPMAGMVKFLPNSRLGAILVISPQRQYLKRAEEWVRRLDAQAQGSEKQLFTYAVQNRRAQELVEILQSIFSNEIGGSGVALSRNVAPNYQEARLQSATGAQVTGSASALSNFAGGAAPAAGGQPGRVQPAGGLGAQSTSTGPLGGDDSRIKIVADEAENAILIEATNKDYQRVLRAVTSLDVMPKQVLIEATIAEVTLTDELKFGVRWYMKNHDASATFSDAISGAVTSVYPGFSYALTAANVTATLNALSGITNVNVVSSPSLTVRDNKPAVLQIGDQVPITTQSATSVLTAGAPVVNSVSYKDTGVILSITPSINKSGRVLLNIEQEVSTVVPTTSSGIDSPTIRQRRIRTNVVVNDGDALVLGGLIQEDKSQTRSQIPILGDIPYIGNAVRYKDDKIHKTELIIVIAPHVIRNLYEARRVTDEYRKQIADSVLDSRRKARDFKRSARRVFE